MIPLTALALVAAANAFVELGEPGGATPAEGLGPMVRHFLREVRNRRAWRDREMRRRAAGRPRAPGGVVWPQWDAAFVHHTGYWSHYDPVLRRSSWPLPATGNMEELAQFAFTTGCVREAPISGDVFLMFDPEHRVFTRTGIITHVDHIGKLSRGETYYKCVTIDGDCDADSLSPGTKTLRRVHNFAPEMGDRFIRWTALDGREERRQLIEEDLDFQAKNVAA